MQRWHGFRCGLGSANFPSTTLNTIIEDILASCFMDDRYGTGALKQTGKKTVIACGRAGEATRWIALPRAGNDRRLLDLVCAAVFGNNPVYHQVAFSPGLLFPLHLT